MNSTKTFSALNDEYKSIMKPYFSAEDFLLFKYYSPIYDGLFFRGSIYQQLPRGPGAQTVNGGSCTVYYTRDILQARSKVRTTGDVRLTFDVDLGKYAKNLSSRVKLNTNFLLDEYGGKLKFLWRYDKLRLKSSLDWDSHKALSLKALGLLIDKPDQQFGAGAGVSFAFEDRQFAVYNATLWYIRNYSKFILAHKTQRNRFGLGSLIGRIYNRVDDKTDVALGFSHSFIDASDLISFGLRYKHSDTFTVKTKIDSNLNMKAAFQLLLDKNLKLIITSNYDLADSNTRKEVHTEVAPPISIRIAFGEI